jgi:hypothetical protein
VIVLISTVPVVMEQVVVQKRRDAVGYTDGLMVGYTDGLMVGYTDGLALPDGRWTDGGNRMQKMKGCQGCRRVKCTCMCSLLSL